MNDYLFEKREREKAVRADGVSDADAASDPVSVSDLASDPVADPDPVSDAASDAALERDVRHLESLLGAFAHRAPLRELPPQRRWRRLARPAALTAAALAALALFFFNRSAPQEIRRACGPSTGPGFAFSLSGGSARCDGEPSATRGTIPVGAWLETSEAAKADVRLADIGDLTVYGDSRLRVVGTSANEHRLELARGKVTARVIAPPRLFIVDTPGATAVDLGCAYELTVDEAGRTHLRVTSGVVSLEGQGKVAYAPALTEVLAIPGRGPGTPISFRAAPAFREAVERFDHGEPSALSAEALALAALDDTITLWNLLPRSAPAERPAVLARLEALSPRPDGVSAAAILAADPAALDLWRDDLERSWGGNTVQLRPHR